MSKILIEDYVAILKGLNKIIKSSIKIQNYECQRKWKNSSVNYMTKELVEATSNIQNDFNYKELAHTLKETCERTSMIYEGIKLSSLLFTDVFKNSDDKITMNELKEGIYKDIYKNFLINSIKRLNKENLNFARENNNYNETDKVKNILPFNNINDILKKPKYQDIELKKISINESAKQIKVPASRIGRLTSFGTLAAGLGVGTIAEVTRRTFGFGNQKNKFNPLLNEANAERIVNTLCKVRGAALKIGQILSIQDNTIIHPSFQKIFERVRQSADFMPSWQVEKVLENNLGHDWRTLFLNFEMKPFAAASIGQVHFATLLDNRDVAIKIQYPGVAKSLESDIDNLFSILRIWDFFPEGMFIDNIIKVAKRELSWEVDYIREADCTKKFKQLLQPYPEYFVPNVIDNLSNEQVFTSDYAEGIPVDKCLELDEETRIYISYLMMRLVLLELFEFRYMQTDPNWSNFLYNPKTQQLILLDFGASRAFNKEFIDVYIEIIRGAADNDRKKVLTLSQKLGFLNGYEQKIMEESHIDAVMILGEIFQSTEPFDFAIQNTTQRIQQLVPTMVKHRLCPPPEEIYSLHRKLSGIFLLCSKLKVKLQCRPLFDDLYNKYKK